MRLEVHALQAPVRGRLCLANLSFNSNFSCQPNSSRSLRHQHCPDSVSHSSSSRYSTRSAPPISAATKDWKTIVSQNRLRKPPTAPNTTTTITTTSSNRNKSAEKLLEKALRIYRHKMEASKEERVDLLNRLRQWIDEQESLEAEGTHDPPPLTEKQRSAILALVPGKNTTSKSDDYGTGNRNWVSEVNTYFQKRQLPSPFYTDESISVPHSNIQWRTWCVFHDGTRLPRVGLGAREGDQPPTFSNKKDSKQYAAQKAYEYLEMIQGNTPTSKPRRSSGAAKTASTHNGLLSTPPAKRPKVKDTSSEPEAVRSSSTMASPTGDASSIFDALNRASVSLGIPGPDIETEPDADVGEGFFKGRAVFVPWAKVPEGLGNKNGILSKNECRVQIAQAVLGWMQQELKQRQELAEALINNINNKTK